MKKFLDNNFLLQNETAEYLYHEHAKHKPIIDYHNHLPAEEIANNRKYDNLTQAWLEGDHYKWRAMRSNGISEEFITGAASDSEKFKKWAETVPYTLRNPLYHWTHLELQRYFGIETLLCAETANEVYEVANGKLQQESHFAVGLLKMQNVESLCTTDDPVDSLQFHQQIAASNVGIKALPTWRPDLAMEVGNVDAYNAYLDKLSEASQTDISTFADLLQALQKRHDFFHSVGCRLSDHGLENFYVEEYTDAEIETIFRKVRARKVLSQQEILKFKSAALYEFALMDHAKGWTQQFHVGPLRDNNTRFFRSIGANTGFDSIGDFAIAQPMARFLDRLDMSDQLAKTILYNLNPADNEVMGTMIGNFQDGSVPGKIQFGSGWWFLDQKDGMQKQMNALSSLGLLSRFVGMLTDSRSYLSFTRHEYFRRILCNLIGTDVENGELPNDRALLGKMVEDISYNNAKSYFNFD